MNVRDLFDNQYLAADDLREKDWTLTISKVTPVKMRKKDGSKESRGAVHFAELEAKATKDKPAMSLVLNRTNAKTLKALYGKETANWIGRRVTIYPTTCDAFGKTADCIRIRPTEPSAKTAPPKDVPTRADADPTEPPSDVETVRA